MTALMKALFRRLGFLLASLLLISQGSPAHGQGGFGNFIQNLFRPIMRQSDTKKYQKSIK